MNSDDHQSRIFPGNPRVGVGIVVIHKERVLLAKRGQQPAKGIWTVPGGLINLGETAASAALREMSEECNINIELLKQIDYFEFIEKEKQNFKYHYIVLEFLARYKSGSLRPQSDVDDCAWFKQSELLSLGLTRETSALIEKAFLEIKYF